LDAIEAEALELLGVDPGQAERFFGNRPVAGADRAFDVEAWQALANPHAVEANALIVVGVDGARFRDSLAMVATEVKTGYQWVLDVQERPANAGEDYEHDFKRADGVMVDTFETFNVWRAYVDPQWIDGLLDKWQGRWGDKTVVGWHTNRPRQMAWAVRNYTAAIGAGDVSHDGHPVFAAHIANARRQRVNVLDDENRPMHILSKDRTDSPLREDLADAAVLSWECRGDAIADGADNDYMPLAAWA
jgi:hypothetical protein